MDKEIIIKNEKTEIAIKEQAISVSAEKIKIKSYIPCNKNINNVQ